MGTLHLIVLVCWCAGVLVWIGGCASSKGHGASDAVPARLDVLPGAVTVIPLELGQVDPWHPVLVRIDGGRKLDATLRQVLVRVPESGDGADDAWLPAAGVWASKAPDSRNRSAPPRGTWVLVAKLPGDGHGRVLTVGKREYLLNWLPTARMLPNADASAPEPLLDPWRPAAPESLATDPAVLARVRGEAMSPLTRWRFHLLVDGLRPGAESPDAAVFSDPVIEALARQNEDRWRVGLLWLWSANAELASRVKQRLAAVVDFGNHTLAPAWSVDHSGLDRLLADLLNPAMTPERRAELAEAWLSGQAPGAAWVIDDGGLLDDQRRAIIPTVGLTNLQDRATLVWASPGGGSATPSEPNPVASMTTLKLLVPPRLPEGDETPPTTSVVAHVGRWSAEMPALCRKIPVVPPGFAVGPLLKDYTMESWGRATVGAAPELTRSDWATAGMLHRPPLGPSAPESASESRRWELLVECRVNPAVKDVESLGRETVRIFFGPSARPTAILRVDLTGTVTDESLRDPLAPPELEVPPGRVEISRAADRWSFRISLPPGAVERDGLLRLGMTRVDALGHRSSWPRPMMPWQTEPGRAALDTTAWAGPVRPE